MNNSTCKADGCEGLIHVKKHGLCRSHYNRWYYTEGQRKAVTREAFTYVVPSFTCLECGKYHDGLQAVGRSMKTRTYCDERCTNQRALRERRQRSREARKFSECQQCGEDISSRKADARFCSAFCSDVSRGARLAEPLAEITCALVGCEVRFVPNRSGTKCCSENHGQIHWNRVSRADGRQKNAPWSDARKAAWHKRRAQKLGTQVEDIRPVDIYERDIWLCGLCLTAVDPDVSWPDPMSASLDHVLPLSKGGTHTYENVQLAHLTCNVSKGNRVAA